MRYVSEEVLKLISEYFGSIKDITDRPIETAGAKAAIDSLIEVECTELPDQQWQTIDEFKANPVDGLCFAMYRNCVCNLNFRNSKFEYEGLYYSDNYITHVMPIKTPEAPK